MDKGIIIGQLPMQHMVLLAKLKLETMTFISFYNNVTVVDSTEKFTEVDYIFKTGQNDWAKRFMSIVTNLN